MPILTDLGLSRGRAHSLQRSFATGLRLPGTSGNYASSPDSVLNSVTGDIDIRWYGKAVTWGGSVDKTLLAKLNTTGNQRAYRLYIDSTNQLVCSISLDGITSFPVVTSAVVVAALVDGQAMWLRATVDVDNGSGGHDGKFYTSADGITWTLATSVTNGGFTGVASIFDSTAVLELGSISGGTASLFNGTVYYAEVRNGIDGPMVAQFDSSQVAASGAQTPATLNGWTWNGSALYKRDDYVRLPGTSGNYLSFPDTVANSVTGDIDIRAHIAMDDWTPAAVTFAIAKEQVGARSYCLGVATGGAIDFRYSVDGTNAVEAVSTANNTLVDGTAAWIRATRVAATSKCNFYTSPDGVTWTLLGAADVVGSAAGNIADTSSLIELGSRAGGGSNLWAGNLYYAEVRNGINGTVVASWDGRVVQTPWTINGAAWNWEGSSFAGKPGIALSIPGTSAGGWATTPDTAGNSVTAAIDVRAKIALDNWADGVNFQGIVSKRASGGQDAYQLRIDPTGPLTLVVFSGGSNVGVPSNVVTGFVAGSTHWVRATYVGDNGASGHTVIYYTSDDGVAWTPLGTAITNAAVKLIDDTTAALNIGAGDLGTSQLMKGKVYYAEVRNGIDGPIVAKFDPTNLAKTGTRTPASTVQPGGSPNMLTPNQASIETDNSGWAVRVNCTAPQSAVQALDGTKSLAVTSVAAGDMSAFSLPGGVGTAGTPVVPGKLYRATINTRADTTLRSVNVAFQTFTAAGGNVSTLFGTAANNSTSAWTENTFLFVAPATAAFATVVAFIVATGGAAEVHYIDRVSLVEAAETWTINGSSWDLVVAS